MRGEKKRNEKANDLKRRGEGHFERWKGGFAKPKKMGRVAAKKKGVGIEKDQGNQGKP